MNENTEPDEHGVIAIEESGGGISYQSATSTTPDFTCPKCFKAFKNQHGLRVHNVRKHGKGWSTAENFKGGGKKKYKSDSAAYRREAYAKLQAGYRAKGLNAQGKPYKAAAPSQVNQGNNPGVMFCPRCGTNIKVIAAALAFGDKQ